MDRNLFLVIEPIEIAHDAACAISDAICELSRNYTATATLLAEYKRLVLDAELQWQKVEAQLDYHYQSRDDARVDFLKLYCKGENLDDQKRIEDLKILANKERRNYETR